MSAHRLEVRLKGLDGLSYELVCDGWTGSECHEWCADDCDYYSVEYDNEGAFHWAVEHGTAEDDEGQPIDVKHRIVGHEDCSAVWWWNEDSQSSLEGYVGPERDSLVSGPIKILSYGEDGFEWEYEEAV